MSWLLVHSEFGVSKEEKSSGNLIITEIINYRNLSTTAEAWSTVKLTQLCDAKMKGQEQLDSVSGLGTPW